MEQKKLFIKHLNTPLLDIIELNKVEDQPDIVLIGAGVGAVNILNQIEDLKCISIDCGFIVDALSDFNLAKKRPYYVNDYYYNKNDWF